MMRIITKTEHDTHSFAHDLAKTLKGGEVIGLVGELGAGKTVFTKGLAAGLGIEETITSPTFVLMKIYDVPGNMGKVKYFIHIDTYRISGPEDITALGAGEYWRRRDTVTVIEWADKIERILPRDTVDITIEYSQNNERVIIVK